MSDHQPLEDATHEAMNDIALMLDSLTPEGYGFTLLMFKMNGKGDGRMNYISNASREDMLAALKELVANFEGRVQHAPSSKQ